MAHMERNETTGTVKEVKMSGINRVAIILTVGLLLATSAAQGDTTVTGVGAMALSSGSTGAAELSGVTWATGTQYYAISDNNARLYPLTVNLDLTTGAITGSALSAHVQLATGTDLEGVAYDSSAGTVFVSDETGPAIREHNIGDGSVVGPVGVPPVYANIVTNYGLESLTLGPGGTSMWTANEEALSVDGPLSSFAAGSVVRLQTFDAGLSPAGQWAYVTDPIAGDVPLTTAERSGVSDLVALPNGQLLVLEREFGLGISLFRSRIYLADFAGATDTSLLPQLATAVYTPVGKQLLWEGNFATDNYEGIALGPQLTDGSYSLLMISDNGGGLSQSLYALKVSVDEADRTPEPAPLGVLALGVSALLRRRRR